MDAELLAKARSGDAAAVTEIVKAHQAMVRSYVARLAPDPVTADDLAQDVFIAALQALDRIDPAIGIRPYILGIARNKVRSMWRERARGLEVPCENLFDLVAARESEAPAADLADLRLDALRVCLERLAPRARDVVVRHYRREQRCDEIARELGTKSGNVRAILTRARSALRTCMQPKLQGAAS